MSTHTENSDEKLKWSYSEKWGFTIIGVGVLLLLLFISYWICGNKPAPESHHIHVYVAVDTLTHNVKDLYTRAEVDTIINLLQNHEDVLAKKYQYILDQKEEEDRFKTYLVIIVSIILSIAAFFGFKTISDLKKQCREESAALSSSIAEKKAVETAERKAAQKAQSVAEQKAQYVAQDTARSVANDTAQTVAKDTARTIAEQTARSVAEETAKNIAEQTAKSIAESIAKEECEKLVRDLSDPIAREVAEETAKSQTSDYLNQYLKKEVRSQIDQIQQTEVFQSLKKENEEVIRISFERIRSELFEETTDTPSNTEDSTDTMSPDELDFSLGNDN